MAPFKIMGKRGQREKGGGHYWEPFKKPEMLSKKNCASHHIMVDWFRGGNGGQRGQRGKGRTDCFCTGNEGSLTILLLRFPNQSQEDLRKKSLFHLEGKGVAKNTKNR